MSKDRVEIFSDAVIAIILTLLILELHVPEIPDHSGLNQYTAAMIPLIPKFISFVLSFVMISIHWVSHHYLFRHLRRVTIEFVWINNLFLLWICFLPFPTAMLGDHPTDQFPILLYGIDSLLTALTFLAFRGYARSHDLFKTDEATAKSMGPRLSIPAIIIYSLSILFAFINVYVSLICFILVPLLYFMPNLLPTKVMRS